MDNGLLIALAIIFTFILMAINIYILALYVHTDDKGFGTAVFPKILVIIGLTLCQAQALMVPLDVANYSAVDRNGIDMKGFWYFLYAIIIMLVCLFLPFSLFFYETDEDESFCRRFTKALIYTVIANIVSIILLFVTWNFFKFVVLPVHEISAAGSSVNNGGDLSNWTFNVGERDTTLQMECSFAVYIIAIMSFFGWFFVVIFGGVGLFALPLDMINYFRNRPRAKKTSQMEHDKKKIVNTAEGLLKEGEQLIKLDNQIYTNSQSGWFDKWKGKRNVNNKMTQYKARFYSLQEEYQIFNIELQYQNSNPIIPCLKLLLGIIFFITSFLWILQIIFGNIAKSFNRPLIPFLNEFLLSLDRANAGFISTGIFAYLCLYILWCVQKGTVKFGIRIPCCCRFHPMKENETWMNSFLFNVIIMLIASVGVIQLCISSFPTYTRNTQIYMMVGIQLNYMKFYSQFYQNSVFTIAIVIWTFLSLIYLLCTCNKKPENLREIQKIKKKGKLQD